MALQLNQILSFLLSEETISSFESASVHRVWIAHSSKTRNVCKILNPSEVTVPCIWLLGVLEAWLWTMENDDCWQSPILSLEAVTLCREN